MPGKVNIGGTAYTVAYGKTKVSGTTYDIGMGKTKIDGTVKEINFGMIPYKYQQVEYLEVSSAGPYIELPISTVEGLKLELYCAPLLPKVGEYVTPQCRLGGGGSESAKKIERFGMDELDDGTFQAYLNAQTRKVEAQHVTGSPASLYYVEGDFGYGDTGTMYITVNGVRQYSASRTSWMTTGEPMYLFAYKTTTISKAEGRFGTVRALNRNNVILMDLYPCYRKSDNTPGFWDTVSKQFLTNAGSGSFSVGPDV